MDLSTTYLGFTLPHPLIPGASPLADSLEAVERLVEAGAPVIQIRSLFEEQIQDEQFRLVQDADVAENTWFEALTYHPRMDEYRMAGIEQYLQHVARVKAAVDVPVIASLNGSTPGGWVEYARSIEEAGADALELNVYFLASDPADSCSAVEERVVEILRSVRATVDIPLAMKLSPFFSSLPHLIARLEDEGAAGVVIFNRFYQPDIDIEELEVVPQLHLSDSSELLLRLRWLALLSGRTGLSLATTGGAHTAEDAIKACMCGAHAVQMVSALLKNGPDHLRRVREELEQWMEAHEYESLGQMRGSMSLAHSPDPSAFERANYIRILQGGMKFV